MSEYIKYYYREYSNTHQVYLNRKLQTISNFIYEIPIIEECIGFQIWFDEQIAEVINSNTNKFREINEKTPNIAKQLAVGFQLYRRNHQYIFSAFELAYSGLCEPAYSILRTVHESVLAQWYIATHPNDSSDILEYMRDNDREGTKYNHNHFLQSLYIGEIADRMREQYSGLSLKSHASVFEMETTEQFDLKQISDCFWFIKTLTFYNIISNVENLCQISEFSKLVLGFEVKSFIERLKNAITNDNKTIPDYFPNKDEFRKKFQLYSLD